MVNKNNPTKKAANVNPFAKNTLHICESVRGSIIEKTPQHANGLPGIYEFAKIGLGGISLNISVSRTPFSQELSAFAWDFRNFAADNGHNYEVNDNGDHLTLEKTLATGDCITAYDIRAVNLGTQSKIYIGSKLSGNPIDLFPAYLQRLEPVA